MSRKKKDRNKHKHVSPKQQAANEINGPKSKGPTSDEGKKHSSLNATKHGLTGEFRLLDWEDLDEYLDFKDAMFAELNPQGILQITAAEMIVNTQWCLSRRISHILAEIEERARSLEDLNRERERIQLYAARHYNQLRKLHQDLRLLKEMVANGEYVPLDNAPLEEVKYDNVVTFRVMRPVSRREGKEWREKMDDIEQSTRGDGPPPKKRDDDSSQDVA